MSFSPQTTFERFSSKGDLTVLAKLKPIRILTIAMTLVAMLALAAPSAIAQDADTPPAAVTDAAPAPADAEPADAEPADAPATEIEDAATGDEPVDEVASEAATAAGTMMPLDWAIIAGYFTLLFAVAWWVIRKNKDTSDDYFLAGRNLGWFVIGASIFASNIGSEHLVGLAGSGCTDGVAMAHYELHAWCLLVLGSSPISRPR